MSDDKTIDLDAIRGRLALWNDELAPYDLLEELEAALALDVGPLIREVETLRAWQTRILDAIGYDDSPESAAEVLEHAHEWRSAQLAEVGYLRGERDRARDLAAALEAELARALPFGPQWGKLPNREPAVRFRRLPTDGTVTLTSGGLFVLDHPDAGDMRHTEAGRIIDGAFQPSPFALFGMYPETLRVIADLIDEDGIVHE